MANEPSDQRRLQKEYGYLLVCRDSEAIWGNSRFNKPLSHAITGVRMGSKEFNDLFCGHMFAIIYRTWSGSHMEVNSTFYLGRRFQCLHVHKLFIASLQVALLQTNSHGQDLSVWEFRFLAPALSQLRQMTLVKIVRGRNFTLCSDFSERGQRAAKDVKGEATGQGHHEILNQHESLFLSPKAVVDVCEREYESGLDWL
jgi:hypothetical protein